MSLQILPLSIGNSPATQIALNVIPPAHTIKVKARTEVRRRISVSEATSYVG
jgi:hypothetical protein